MFRCSFCSCAGSAAVLCLSHGAGVQSPIPSTDLLDLEKWVNSICFPISEMKVTLAHMAAKGGSECLRAPVRCRVSGRLVAPLSPPSLLALQFSLSGHRTKLSLPF